MHEKTLYFSRGTVTNVISFGKKKMLPLAMNELKLRIKDSMVCYIFRKKATQNKNKNIKNIKAIAT